MRSSHAQLALIFVVFLLTACSGEPSDKDIHKALQAYFQKQNDKLQEGAKFFGDSFAKKVVMEMHSARKIECSKKESDLGYLCAAEVDATTPLAGRKKEIKKIRLIKNHGIWEVLEFEES